MRMRMVRVILRMKVHVWIPPLDHLVHHHRRHLREDVALHVDVVIRHLGMMMMVVVTMESMWTEAFARKLRRIR